jgi:CRP-like cAMP-binding protein
MIPIMSAAIFNCLFESATVERRYGAGASLFRAGDPVSWMFLIVSGEARLVRSLQQGNVLSLQRAGPGAVVAEASLFAERYHCDGTAALDTVARILAVASMHETLLRRPELLLGLTGHFAEAIQRARAQNEILTLRTVRERLDAWIAFNGDAMPRKGGWRGVASEIGVSPEALYREMARRR